MTTRPTTGVGPARARAGAGRHVLRLGLLAGALALALAAGPGPARASHVDRVERAVVVRINAVRRHHGLVRLRIGGGLTRAAEAHSREMLGRRFFAHTSASGRPWFSRVRAYTRARTLGETIAWIRGHRARGQAGRVVRAWLRSPGHRAQLLSGRFHVVGVGRRRGRYGGARVTVYTADFSSRR